MADSVVGRLGLGAILILLSGTGLCGREAVEAAAEPAPVGAGTVRPPAGNGDIEAPDFDMSDPGSIPRQPDEPEPVASDPASYRFYIADLERRGGPYARGLSEQLQGLGAVYRDQGLHGEAIEAFKRGVHVARINNGLYSPEQIPLLQGLIESLVASGDFERADERQGYLYRIQRDIYGENSEQMSSAMLQRAAWERKAYYLALGDTAFTRLLTMWELYGTVIGSIADRKGNTSPELLEPLTGLLQTQYMISSYSGESRKGPVAASSADLKFVEKDRFGAIRTANYKQGKAVIEALRDVYDYNEDEQSPLPAETRVQLGDWHLWHGKWNSAVAAYRQAWDELGELENGAIERQVYFSRPVMLPDTPGSPGELKPPASIRGYAEASYYISPKGRVRDLELLKLEPVDESDDAEPIQLLRRIRRMLYRPVLVDREPVATETITKRYAY